MDLFGYTPSRNLLPADGEAYYHGPILSASEAAHYRGALLERIEWRHDEAFLYGKRIVTARQVAWYGDRQYAYTYSGTTKQALLWTPELEELKALVETKSGSRFNSCLLNLYQTGDEGMSWHSDDEKALGRNTTIASLSLGAERKFSFRHKATGDTLSLMLEEGSLLIMTGSTQTHWQHCVPKTKRVSTPRINLTFRTIVTP